MPPRSKTAAKKPAAKRPPAKKRGSRKSANVIEVDFTDVDAGGMMPTPDGIYTAEVRSAEKDVSSAGNEMVVVRYKTNIGSTVYDRFMLLPQSLWVLRTALQCMGYDTPDGPFSFDPDDLVGEKLGLEIMNEEYEEKDQPNVMGYLTVDAAEQQLTGAPAPAEEEEEEEEPEEEEEESEEEEEEEEETPKKSRKKAPAKEAAKKKAPAKKKSTALRPGASVTFEDEDDEYHGVIEAIDDGIATVIDDEDGEWEIPVKELTKA